MMARVGDSEIGGHTQSTLLYQVVPDRALIQGGKPSQLCDFSATKGWPGFWTSSYLGMKAELSLLSC